MFHRCIKTAAIAAALTITGLADRMQTVSGAELVSTPSTDDEESDA